MNKNNNKQNYYNVIKYIKRIILVCAKYFHANILNKKERKFNMNKISDKFDALNRKKVNDLVLKQTYKYQKIYNFKMGTGNEATHNNEADAFKHAFMSAYLSIVNGKSYSKSAGDWHEYIDGFYGSLGERNMDLWNNSIGREIADKIKRQLGSNYDKYSLQEKLDFVSDEIIDRMRNDELITNPNDKRQFKNMFYERLQDKDRIFHQDEFWDMDEQSRHRYSEHYTNYKNKLQGKLPTKTELNLGVIKGDYIYVNNYTRGDGVEVRGYYRRRPVY